MRQLKLLLFLTLALTFVGGIGTGAWIGSLVAGPEEPRGTAERRVADYTEFYDLNETQQRELETILLRFDHRRGQIRQLTAEQLQEMRRLEDETRANIRALLTAEQQRKYDVHRAGR